MLKKFMIESIDHTQVSDTTGTIIFHLVDENGDYRNVRGSTFLNEDNEPQGITAESIRELPLIENLFSNRHKKIIEVEFDHFNKAYDRDTDQTINKVAYDTVMKIQGEKKFSRRVSDFFKR
ncbi:MAG: hypothetical protein V7749_12435 [Cocleimonas sp.]